MHVSEVLGDYLASIKHLAKGTQRLYQMHLSVFADWCTQQGVELEQVNNRRVQSFLEWLRLTRKPKKRGQTAISTHTIADYVRSISALLHWCLSDEEYGELVKLQTIKNIKMPRVEQTIKPVFTDEEITALFNACQSPEKTHEYQLRDTAILALLLDCGLRAAELRTLTINGLNQMLYRLAELAGVKDCHAHKFRHTFACQYLMQQAGDIYMLSKLMGHSSIDVTQIYVQTIRAHQARQLSKSVFDQL